MLSTVWAAKSEVDFELHEVQPPAIWAEHSCTAILQHIWMLHTAAQCKCLYKLLNAYYCMSCTKWHCMECKSYMSWALLHSANACISDSDYELHGVQKPLYMSFARLFYTIYEIHWMLHTAIQCKCLCWGSTKTAQKAPEISPHCFLFTIVFYIPVGLHII